MRPFRFAFGCGRVVSRKELQERARAAEEIGYSVALIADHLLDQLAPIPTLQCVADATERLRVGTIVFNNDLRHPAVLAQDLATVDQLSGGRLEIGMGAGWNQVEYERTNLSFDGAGVRIARLEESLKVLKGLFGEGSFTLAGEHYRLKDMDGRPKPAQKPHPPFMVGGGGPRLLRLAAREADIVGFAPRTPFNAENVRTLTLEGTAEKVGWVREAAGERFAGLELNTYPAIGPVAVVDDPRPQLSEISERLKANLGATLTVAELEESPHVFIGPLSFLVDKVRMLRERLGLSYFLLATPELGGLAPLVEQLAGT
ncbi:MAG TPA: TIGR03621 family F420-dependent LLM class oxidoreductase [Candidatus Acidoferrales bacterium]|nr:TIGR03621 family F420-dependent LLM class oxidoreductase [Candidatus Acidoferrales bacterium]